MEIKIEITDYDTFYEKTYGGSNQRLFNNSTISPDIESEDDDDDRDINILELLTDHYTLKLDIDDISEFIDMVENTNSVICDLSNNNEDVKFVEHMLSQHREEELYTESYIISNLDKDYRFLSHKTLSLLPLNLFENHSDKFNWSNISYLDLPIEFIRSNKELLEWDILSINIDEKYYEEFRQYIKLHYLIEDNLPSHLVRGWKIDNLLD